MTQVDKKATPSIVWLLALRLALVVLIQVTALALLAMAVPRFMAALGTHVLGTPRLALQVYLEQEARELAEHAASALRSPAEPGAAVAAAAALPWRYTPHWALALGDDGALLAGEGPATLTPGLRQQLATRLRSLAGSGAPLAAYVFDGNTAYAAGAARLTAAGSNGWLVLLYDEEMPARDSAARITGAEHVRFAAVNGVAQPPLSFGQLASGRLQLAVPVPGSVGSEDLALLAEIPIPTLSRLLRGGTIIFAAALVLLPGTLYLAFAASYSQFTKPFAALLAAVRAYGAGEPWRPPAPSYREQALATEAIDQAVRARQRAEAEARQRWRELRTFIDSMPALAVLKDTDLHYLLVNSGFAQALNVTPEEVIGKSDSDLYPPELAEVFEKHDRQVLEQRQPLQFDEEYFAGGQRRFWRTVKAPVMDEAGQIAGLVSIAIDVSERKAMEEHLLEAQKMQVVGRLAGGLAHTFNNVLTTILGSAELALMSLDEDNPAYGDVTQIRDAAERGAVISNQLLTLSRQRTGQVETLRIDELLRELLPMLRDCLSPGTTLHLSPATDLPPVQADRTQLKQLILNLAMNAGEAMPNGGTLIVRAFRCQPPTSATALEPALLQGPWVCISLRDSGCGIAEDAKPHIFEPFFTTKGESRQRGLGLTVAYNIARQHHGTITFESSEGKGSQFNVYLPGSAEVEPQQAAATVASDQAALTRGHETVLVVDDETTILQLAQRMLTTQGYTVWAATSAQEAIALLAEKGRAPDLLLSDVVMPGISGMDLAKRIVAEHPETKVLLMSGFAGEGEQGTLGGFAVLWKPFSLQTLARSVRAALDAGSG